MRCRLLWIVLAATNVVLPLPAAYGGGVEAIERIKAGDCKGAGDEINEGLAVQDANAYLAAGYLYDSTGCVAHDPERAARYYRRAADLGNPDAVDFLGLIYALGNGVHQDYQVAYHAFNYLREKDANFKPAREGIQAATGYALAVTQIARSKAHAPSGHFSGNAGTVMVILHMATGDIDFDAAGFSDSSSFQAMVRKAYKSAFEEAPPLNPDADRDVTFMVPWKLQTQ